MHRLLLVLSVLFLGFSVQAKGGDGKKFEEKKAQKLQNIDTRIASLQTMKTCATAATNREAMKECRKAHKERVKGLRPNHKKHEM